MDNAKLVLSDAKENLKVLQEEYPGMYTQTYLMIAHKYVRMHSLTIFVTILYSYMPTYKISSLYVYNFR